jgi:hypothetical protein
MKITLTNNSFSSVKINLQRFHNNIAYHAHQIIEDIKINDFFKINLVYYTSVVSVISLLAFVQLNNTDNAIKIVLGLVVLFGNFWLLKKYNL